MENKTPLSLATTNNLQQSLHYLRSTWKVPFILQFFAFFGTKLGLPEISPEYLEEMLLSTEPGPVWVNIHRTLLGEIMSKKPPLETWQQSMRRLFERRRKLIIGEFPFIDEYEEKQKSEPMTINETVTSKNCISVELSTTPFERDVKSEVEKTDSSEYTEQIINVRPDKIPENENSKSSQNKEPPMSSISHNESTTLANGTVFTNSEAHSNLNSLSTPPTTLMSVSTTSSGALDVAISSTVQMSTATPSDSNIFSSLQSSTLHNTSITTNFNISEISQSTETNSYHNIINSSIGNCNNNNNNNNMENSLSLRVSTPVEGEANTIRSAAETKTTVVTIDLQQITNAHTESLRLNFPPKLRFLKLIWRGPNLKEGTSLSNSEAPSITFTERNQNRRQGTRKKRRRFFCRDYEDVSDENDDIYGDDDDEEYKADSDNFDDDDDDDDFDEDDDEDFGRKRRRRKKKSSSRKKKVTKKPEEKDTSEEESSVLAENTRRRKRQKIDPSLLRRSERLQKYSNPSNENILHNNNKFVNKQPRNRNSQIKTETHSLVDVNNNRNSKNEDESTQRSTLVSLEEDNDESDDNENDDHNSDHDDIESNSGFDSERNYYSYLPVHFRVSILWHLTEWCLDRSEKVAREIEKWTLSDLKPTPLVRDAAGNCYWYFGTRSYSLCVQCTTRHCFLYCVELSHKKCPINVTWVSNDKYGCY
jgi:hypothetical protein